MKMSDQQYTHKEEGGINDDDGWFVCCYHCKNEVSTINSTLSDKGTRSHKEDKWEILLQPNPFVALLWVPQISMCIKGRDYRGVGFLLPQEKLPHHHHLCCVAACAYQPRAQQAAAAGE